MGHVRSLPIELFHGVGDGSDLHQAKAFDERVLRGRRGGQPSGQNQGSQAGRCSQEAYVS